MKLLNRTSYILLTTIIFVFFAGSITFYFILKSATDREISNELETRMEFIQVEFSDNPEALKHLYLPGYIHVDTSAAYPHSETRMNDTMLLDQTDNTYQSYRFLASTMNTDEGYYEILVFKSLKGSNELVEIIVMVLTLINVVFILVIYLLNRFLFERTWSDFFKTIGILKSYDVNQGNEISFPPSEISEFDLLNSTLQQMIDKIDKDYKDINEFTGNISHEIQTPLTIIRQKSELLLQSEPLNPGQAKLIRDIQSTNSRLSKLNRTLVLLTKVENKHFTAREKINLHEVIENLLENFESLAEIKSITVIYKKNEEVTLMADSMLIEVMLLNLIKNAIGHNTEEGEILIQVDKNSFQISNTSKQPDLKGLDIFARYSKISKGKDSLGLGLSLVKRICIMYGYDISYAYHADRHVFTIMFGQND